MEDFLQLKNRGRNIHFIEDAHPLHYEQLTNNTRSPFYHILGFPAFQLRSGDTADSFTVYGHLDADDEYYVLVSSGMSNSRMHVSDEYQSTIGPENVSWRMELYMIVPAKDRLLIDIAGIWMEYISDYVHTSENLLSPGMTQSCSDTPFTQAQNSLTYSSMTPTTRSVQPSTKSS